MNSETTSNLFMVPSKTLRFYQQLLKGVSDYASLGNRIIAKIKTAHAFRQAEQVRELSRVLINIPIKEYQLIAKYYLILSDCQDEACQVKELETIIEQTETYKSQALTSRAWVEGKQGRLEASLHFYSEAIKAARNVPDYITATMGIAMIKGLEGFHESALKDMESLNKLVKHAEPVMFFNFYNSYSIELGASGRIYEARNIIHHVLESPFAFAYPEWRETEQELMPASRSFVVPRPKRVRKAKVLRMPERDISGSLAGPLADVIGMAEWKDKMGKGKKGKGNGDKFKPADKMSGAEMVVEIMRVCIDPKTTDEQRRLIYAEMVRVLNAPPKDDDDDDPAS